MSLIRSTIIMMNILVLSGTQQHSIDFDVLCGAKTLGSYVGSILVESSKRFQVKCDEGFVTPLYSPSQSYIYSCDSNKLDKKIPTACVEKRIPYRKVVFKILMLDTDLARDFCLSKTKHFNLSKCYNDTVETYIPKFQHKLYIVNCSLPQYPGDYIRVHAIVNKLLKRNTTSDVRKGGHAYIVLKAFKLLSLCSVQLGYLTLGEVMNWTLVYNANRSIIAYHCDDHLVLRDDTGERVCVGCGKGFWMDRYKKCHPCGPGFYNPLETAVECLPCPVQYTHGLWSAASMNECFQTRRDQLIGVSRILEVVIVPITYLLILLGIGAVIHKKTHGQMQQRKVSRLDSGRFSSAFQSQ